MDNFLLKLWALPVGASYVSHCTSMHIIHSNLANGFLQILVSNLKTLGLKLFGISAAKIKNLKLLRNFWACNIFFKWTLLSNKVDIVNCEITCEHCSVFLFVYLVLMQFIQLYLLELSRNISFISVFTFSSINLETWDCS